MNSNGSNGWPGNMNCTPNTFSTVVNNFGTGGNISNNNNNNNNNNDVQTSNVDASDQNDENNTNSNNQNNNNKTVNSHNNLFRTITVHQSRANATSTGVV